MMQTTHLKMSGDEFRRRREQIGFKTRSATAAAIGVGLSTVKSWESGIRPLPPYALKWLQREEVAFCKQMARK